MPPIDSKGTYNCPKASKPLCLGGLADSLADSFSSYSDSLQLCTWAPPGMGLVPGAGKHDLYADATRKLIEALGSRIGVMREKHANSADGMRIFGVTDLTSG